MLGRVSLVLILIAAPLISQAQVTNLVINPSFEDENDIVDSNWVPGWVTWGEGVGLESEVIFDEEDFIDGARSLRVEPKGSVNWHFMVINYPIALKMGKTYSASFWARAEEPRPITTKVKANDNSVDFALTDFQITTDWAEYTKTFDAGATDVKLEIWVSGTDVPVWLDFVYMYEGDYVEGIMPSEISSKSVESAGKLAVQWSKLKTQQ